MKTCPSCQRKYEDESLVFCLDDGARLVRDPSVPDANATYVLPTPGPTVASPRQTSPVQPTLTARPGQFQQRPGGDQRVSKSSVLPWLFAIVLVLAGAGVLIAWLVTRERGGELSSRYPSATPTSSARPSPSAEPTEIEKPVFAMLNNMTFKGTRITYYQRASFFLCQADCNANANCAGLTWIRPGAYNPGDPGMCYLMSEVTERVPHNCCISATRN